MNPKKKPPFRITGKGLKRQHAKIMEQEMWKRMQETGEWDQIQAEVNRKLLNFVWYGVD